MAFTNTKGRYASFGVVTSLPGEMIDSFWYVIDQYLKNVVPLRNTLRFQLRNNKGKVCLIFTQKNYPHQITVDFNYPFDPFYPRTILVVDRDGRETITLPDEMMII